ncbi:hypothetical protein BACI348_30311 [Bacillus altitudinis]|uniref:Uncharacterized protein n=1 Tax=Bacillus altitudinis TaxID=293387 RepID=A0A653N6V6_BACAB|nr:hypothetical protein BACI348_30311 [Bacillus altitudinis]
MIKKPTKTKLSANVLILLILLEYFAIPSPPYLQYSTFYLSV